MRSRRTASVAFVLLAGFSTAAASGAETSPGLLFTPEQAAAMRQRIQSDPRAAEALHLLEQKVAPALSEPVDLPPRPGNWPHFNVCPTHGATLKQGKLLAPWRWQHICPIDGAVIPSDPAKAATDFDAVIYWEANNRNAQNVLAAGVLYQATGDKRYADFVRSMALAYADRFDDYRRNPVLHEKHELGGVQWAGLDEAVWLDQMVQGIDCVWPTFSPAERTAVEQKLLRAEADLLRPEVTSAGIGNHITWINGPLGLIGLMFGDKSLVSLAVDDPKHGDRTQLAKGVLPDGQWFEGSWGYHNYTLGSLWPLVRAASNAGIDLYLPAYKRMLDGPLLHAQPNLLLPMFNDGWPDAVPSIQYPMAWAHWHDPMYLEAMPTPAEAPLQVLIFGLPPQHDAATEPAIARRSMTLPSGYTILRSGAGRQATWLDIKYGPHGGGHGHPDKNHFILFARGQLLMPDFGSINYASIVHKDWARSTLAHNTLVVDGRSQAPTTGKLLSFSSDLAGGAVQYSSSDAGPIYPGLRFVRTALLVSDDLLVFVDRITADQPHQYDLAMHHFGQWVNPPHGSTFVPPPGAEPAHKYLADPQQVPLDSLHQLSIKTDAGTQDTFLFPAGAGSDAELVVTSGPDRDVKDRVPMLLLRRHAKDATFVWGLSIGHGGDRIDARPDGDHTRLVVHHGSRTLHLQVNSIDGTVREITPEQP